MKTFKYIGCASAEIRIVCHKTNKENFNFKLKPIVSVQTQAELFDYELEEFLKTIFNKGLKT